MDLLIEFFQGKIVNIFVMWAMLGIILWFASGLIGKAPLNAFKHATKMAFKGIGLVLGHALAFIMRFVANAIAYVFHWAIWLGHAAMQWLSRKSQPPRYMCKPRWKNHFPPEKKKKGEDDEHH